MSLWLDGDIKSLFNEASTIQGNLQNARRKMNSNEVSRIFSKLIFEGKINSAIRFLDRNSGKGGVQQLSPDVITTLKKLHPAPEPAKPSTLMKGIPPSVNPIIFDGITDDLIRKSALRTNGSAGVSSGDAVHWRRLLFSFGDASKHLGSALAAMSRRLCSQYLDPISLSAFLANRLIPLDKNPGTRPIGIGEVSRRIISKAIMTILKPYVMKSTGATQLFTGQKSGIEAIIHAMIEMFEIDENDAILLVDATNAFNLLNREAALHNIRFLCPSLVQY